MTQQTQPEYTVEAIDDRLFRMERLAYECILNHPESKGFCTEIQHISKELREAIRSRPHTPPRFNSTELINMAHREWKNRQKRKGHDDAVPWTSGWISGYLTGRSEP